MLVLKSKMTPMETGSVFGGEAHGRSFDMSSKDATIVGLEACN
jgi:hypothetical protein